jgi:hypothetical protein
MDGSSLTTLFIAELNKYKLGLIKCTFHNEKPNLFDGFKSQTKKQQQKTSLLKSMNKICSFATCQLSGGMQIVDALSLIFGATIPLCWL